MKKLYTVLNLIVAILFSWLYLPHLLICILGGGKSLVYSDIEKLEGQMRIKLPKILSLLYLLHTNQYFRTVFYHRIGRTMSMVIGWLRPGDKYFTLSHTTKIGMGFTFAHPYSTIVAAESIGDNFKCIQCTTIGNTNKGRPTIGNNVSVGANVVIVGPVRIGNNVKIGAGSVVVKDIPDNSIAVGNPARVIKSL